jgi:hypothetical protein
MGDALGELLELAADAAQPQKGQDWQDENQQQQYRDEQPEELCHEVSLLRLSPVGFR